MNVEGMTRENVASHLQKYRLHLKRTAGYPPEARLSPDALQQLQQVGAPASLSLSVSLCSLLPACQSLRYTAHWALQSSQAPFSHRREQM